MAIGLAIRYSPIPSDIYILKQIFEVFRINISIDEVKCNNGDFISFTSDMRGDTTMQVITESQMDDGSYPLYFYYQIFTIDDFIRRYPYKIGDEFTLKDTDDTHLKCKITGARLNSNGEVNYYFDTLDGKKCGVVDMTAAFVDDDLSELRIPIYSQAATKEQEKVPCVGITFDEATQLYKLGGVGKQIAIKAYGEKIFMIDELPRSWGEFLATHSSYIALEWNHVPQEYFAVYKLKLLRDCYRMGWEPDYNDDSDKYTIYMSRGQIRDGITQTHHEFLSFETPEIRNAFRKNFGPLIKEVAKLGMI